MEATRQEIEIRRDYKYDAILRTLLMRVDADKTLAAAPLRNVFLTSASKSSRSTVKIHGWAGLSAKQNALVVADRKDKNARSTNGSVRLHQRGTMAVGTGQIRRAYLSNETIDHCTEESVHVYVMRVCQPKVS